ncbi:MAG: hypothetical protein ACLFWG_10355 [Longimicrobiales bacterium]
MRHLTDESLARLVDEQPTAAEEEHLRSCETCTTVLRELREQTEALASLPSLRPPAGDWEELEARLVRKGLIGAGRLERVRPETEGMRRRTNLPPGGGPPGRKKAGTGSLFRIPRLQAAAAVVLFLGGTAFGAWMTPGREGPTGEDPPGVSAGPAIDEVGNLGGDATGALSSVDEAALELRTAEARYVDALTTYRELLRHADGSDGGDAENPAARYAALEALVAASQEAIRHAPADPFFNGVLASTMAERQEAIRQISTSADDSWF